MTDAYTSLQSPLVACKVRVTAHYNGSRPEEWLLSRYGRPGCSDEEVEAAADDSAIHEAISTRFPQGYDTIVGDALFTVCRKSRQAAHLLPGSRLPEDSPAFVPVLLGSVSASGHQHSKVGLYSCPSILTPPEDDEESRVKAFLATSTLSMSIAKHLVVYNPPPSPPPPPHTHMQTTNLTLTPLGVIRQHTMPMQVRGACG